MCALTVKYTFRVPNKNAPKACLCSPPSCRYLVPILTMVIMFKCTIEAPAFTAHFSSPLVTITGLFVKNKTNKTKQRISMGPDL